MLSEIFHVDVLRLELCVDAVIAVTMINDVICVESCKFGPDGRTVDGHKFCFTHTSKLLHLPHSL